MNFVGVDIGASGTRYVTNKGKVRVLPNNMVMLQNEAELAMEPRSDAITDRLELFVSHHKNGAILGSWHLAYGHLASRYSGTTDTPNMMVSKFEQDINILSTVLAAALGVIEDGLNPKLALYLALPPAEVKAHLKDVQETFDGTWRVYLPKLDKTVELQFSYVMAYEESFLALLDFFFQPNGAPRPEAMKYATGNLLSLDIGASTTDLAIVSDMQYMEHTGRTIRVGGNVTRQYMQDWVSQTYGYDARPETLDRAIMEGRIQLGNTMVDCSGAVKEAKRQLAKAIVSQVTNYFRSVNIPIQTLRAIVVSGGGSMRGMYSDDQGVHVTSPGVSEYITEFLLGICNTVAIEPMERSPRMANIHGLFIRASLDLRARAKKAAEQAAEFGAQVVTESHEQTEQAEPTEQVEAVTPTEEIKEVQSDGEGMAAPAETLDGTAGAGAGQPGADGSTGESDGAVEGGAPGVTSEEPAGGDGDGVTPTEPVQTEEPQGEVEEDGPGDPGDPYGLTFMGPLNGK